MLHLDDLDHELTAALHAGDMAEFERLAAEADRRRDEREARLAHPAALSAGALWYANQGIPVFPLEARGKRPYPGSRGFKDASIDVDQVRYWWATRPTSNIGIPTGGLFDVIDVDGEQGSRSLVELHGADAVPTVYGHVTTARACGKHLYIAATGDGNATGVCPGIDYRGAGGYVVAPPSVGPGGRRYDWLYPLDVAGLVAARQQREAARG